MKIHITNSFKSVRGHYVNSIVEAFKSLGHEVFEFNNEEFPSPYLVIDRIIKRSPFFALARKKGEMLDFKEKHKTYIGRQWLSTLKEVKPDLVIVINGDRLSREAVKIAKEDLDVPNMVCWIVDHPGVSVTEDLPSFLPYYDVIFVVDPGWIPFLNFFNKKIKYLPLATSDRCYRPLNQKREIDFSFVGSFFAKDPAGFLRAFIISHLSPNYKTEIYGPGINYFKGIYPRLKEFNCYDRHINVTEVNKVWNRSKLTAVIYHPQVADGTSPRVFDAALTGVLQIIQGTPTITDLFPGIDLPIFRTVPEFVDKADYYLSHPREREELAKAILEVVKEKHLFKHRIGTMLELLNLK